MSTPCRICNKPTTQGGDGWDGMCPECADIEHEKSQVDPDDFGELYLDVLDDDSDKYGLEPGEIFGGIMHLLGTYGHVTLIHCAWDPVHGVPVAVQGRGLDPLVYAAKASDHDVYLRDKEQPKWVKLAAWPGRLYLLTFAPGAA